jgi:hypothetical protein
MEFCAQCGYSFGPLTPRKLVARCGSLNGEPVGTIVYKNGDASDHA